MASLTASVRRVADAAVDEDVEEMEVARQFFRHTFLRDFPSRCNAQHTLIILFLSSFYCRTTTP